MRLPWKKPPKPPFFWEFEPYAFERGRIYVIEIDRSSGVDLNQIKELDEYFTGHGVHVKLVLSPTGKSLQPMNVKRMTEYKK